MNKTALIIVSSILAFVGLLIFGGITFLLVLPKFSPLHSKAKATEAQLQLSQITVLEKIYHKENSTFSYLLNEIGFEAPQKIIEGGNSYYEYEIIEASVNTFKARATAVADFDQDGTLDVWEIDQDKKLVNTVKD